MSIMETIKAAGKVVVEAVKAHPVAAAAIGVTAAAAVGGGIYMAKRGDKKKEEAKPAEAKGEAAPAAESTKPELKVVEPAAQAS